MAALPRLLALAPALWLVGVASAASLADRIRWVAAYHTAAARAGNATNGTNGTCGCGGNGTNGTNGTNGSGCSCGGDVAEEPPPPYKTPPWDGDAKCIPQTGRRCFGGPSDCQPWVACSPDFYCVCHHWGCADAAGQCRPVFNQWIDTEVSIAPLPRNARGHYYMSMPVDGETRPTVKTGYPKHDEPEAKWSFLVQPDQRTVMITTKLNRAQTNPNHVAYGFFLDLPPPPWEDGELLSPYQTRPKDALEAAWRLVSRPQGRVAFQHVSSGRFLCFDLDEEKIGFDLGKMSSCSEQFCGKYGKSIDFDLWPRPRTLGVLLGEAPPPSNASSPYKESTKPFKQRDANTSAATDRGFLVHGENTSDAVVTHDADASAHTDGGLLVSHRVFAQRRVATRQHAPLHT